MVIEISNFPTLLILFFFSFLLAVRLYSEKVSDLPQMCNQADASPQLLQHPEGGRALLKIVHKQLNVIGADGAAMWHTGKIPEQTGLLFDTARKLSPQGGRVCEVGFNVGHSASTLIIATGASSYVGFDYGEKPAVLIAVDYLRNVFVEDNVTLELYLGNSQTSLPSYYKDNPDAVCDVVHIDGSHDGHFPLSDFQNVRAMARKDGKTLVLFDDCGCPTEWCVAPLTAFSELLSAGSITAPEEKETFFSAGGGIVRTCFGFMTPHRKEFSPYPHHQTNGDWVRDYE